MAALHAAFQPGAYAGGATLERGGVGIVQRHVEAVRHHNLHDPRAHRPGPDHGQIHLLTSLLRSPALCHPPSGSVARDRPLGKSWRTEMRRSGRTGSPTRSSASVHSCGRRSAAWTVTVRRTGSTSQTRRTSEARYCWTLASTSPNVSLPETTSTARSGAKLASVSRLAGRRSLRTKA